MEYTKGAWFNNVKDSGMSDDGAIIVKERPDEIIVTDVYGANKAERQANTNLISACPDMYEALKEVVKFYEKFKSLSNDEQQIFEKSTAALLKAEGKE